MGKKGSGSILFEMTSIRDIDPDFLEDSRLSDNVEKENITKIIIVRIINKILEKFLDRELEAEEKAFVHEMVNETNTNFEGYKFQ